MKQYEFLTCIKRGSYQYSSKFLFKISSPSLNYELNSLRESVSRITQGFWGTLSHALSKERFKASTDSWDEPQASASKMYQTESSMGFKSDNEGGQSSLVQKLGKLSSHQNCLFFYVCDGAPYWWNVNGLSLKCFLASWISGVKINSM